MGVLNKLFWITISLQQQNDFSNFQESETNDPWQQRAGPRSNTKARFFSERRNGHIQLNQCSYAKAKLDNVQGSKHPLSAFDNFWSIHTGILKHY
jgi:hypothetical protein